MRIGIIGTALLTVAGVFTLCGVQPQALAQGKLVIGKEHGTEVQEVTAGPGWKTCPRCQNNGHIKAAHEKYKVDGHPFNPRDLSGVWETTGSTWTRRLFHR